jgi:hypothetical protein
MGIKLAYCRLYGQIQNDAGVQVHYPPVYCGGSYYSFYHEQMDLAIGAAQ